MKFNTYSLPSGWSWSTLGKIADVVGGGTPRTKDASNFNGGRIPWLTPADLSGYTGKYISHGLRFISEKGLKSSSARMLPKGTVLFSSRAPVGYVAIASNPVCTNQGFKSFVLKEGVIPDYVYWWLKGNKELAESFASGTTFLELSGAKAKQLPIPVAPLNGQRVIVEEIEKQLSRLDEAVANIKRVKANLKHYKASVLKAAVEGRLVEPEAVIARREGRNYETGEQLLRRIVETRRNDWKGKGKYKVPAPPATDDLPNLPEGWAVASLEQLTSAERVICYGILMPKEDVPEGVLYVKVKNLKGDKVNLQSLERTSHEIAAKYARSALKTGDLLLSIRGTYGRVAEVPPELAGGNVTQDTARVVVSPLLNAGYIASFLRSDDAQRYFKRVARGVAVKGVNIADVRVCPVSVPSLAEQERITDEIERRLSVIREVEQEVESNLKRAERLRQSVLSLAFSGKLIRESRFTNANAHVTVRANVRHFSRAVLSAEIVHRLHNEATFGRVKHQKIFHLCEYIAQLDTLQGEYKRKAAGPLDNKLIYANESELKRQQWYQAVSRQGKGHKYVPLEKAGSHQKYLESYWPDRLGKVSELIELMRTWTTERCEVFSTAYAAWNDLLIWEVDATDDAILDEILNRWNDSKKRIPESRWKNALRWMRDNGYAPVGFGNPTGSEAGGNERSG